MALPTKAGASLARIARRTRSHRASSIQTSSASCRMRGGTMSQQIDLQKLARDVQYLVDRQAIVDVIAKHARGHDRHDVELLTGAYHEDGIDEHGHAINPGPDYAAWANAVHAAGSVLHTHNITTHTCEIDGDV